MTPTTLTLDLLNQACAGAHVALRRRRRLQPAGGPGDKVFPPTYEGGKYALEERVIDGKRTPCVLLDSVQSQANRIELALLEAHKVKRIQVPLVQVEFGDDLQEVGTLTSLEVPHRLADAILRDSLKDGVKFRDTEEGTSLNTASISSATGLFGICPTALLLGLWDSTGPRGGLGTKFQRALVSEITGIDTATGAKVSSRLDPLGIQKDAGLLFQAKEGSWTLDESAAEKDKGKAVKLGKDGKPSEANHGNVTPTIADGSGGITMSHALQTVVISLPALRRLRFPIRGTPAPATDTAARTVLAALGLCGATLSISQGCDLRSRCLMVPEAQQAGWELIAGDGSVTEVALDAEAACSLLKSAVAAATTAGLPWRTEPVRLTPSPGLATLVRKSRELAMQSSAAEA